MQNKLNLSHIVLSFAFTATDVFFMQWAAYFEYICCYDVCVAWEWSWFVQEHQRDSTRFWGIWVEHCIECVSKGSGDGGRGKGECRHAETRQEKVYQSTESSASWHKKCDALRSLHTGFNSSLRINRIILKLFILKKIYISCRESIAMTSILRNESQKKKNNRHGNKHDRNYIETRIKRHCIILKPRVVSLLICEPGYYTAIVTVCTAASVLVKQEVIE